MDVDGRWVSGDTGSKIKWEIGNLETEQEGLALKRWQVQRENELLLSEIRDRAEWGTLHFTGPCVGPICQKNELINS
jgi:hypothetical protein